MEKKILNEINDMRIKMGLNVLTENSILLTEGPIGSLVKTIAGKAAIKDVEKALIDKFITGGLDDAEKIAFKDFLKSMNGTKFIKEFETAIAKETDPATKLRAQAFLDNQIKSKLKSTISTTGSKSTSTVGSKSGKGSPKLGKVVNFATPSDITANIIKLVKSPGNTASSTEIDSFIREFVTGEVGKGNISIGRTTIEEIVGDIQKSLNPAGIHAMDVISSSFKNLTIAEQRKIAQNIAKNLESTIPPVIKSKPWFKESFGGIMSNLRFFTDEAGKFSPFMFAKAVSGVYLAIGVCVALYQFNFNDTDDYKTKLSKSFWWLKTAVDSLIGDGGKSSGESKPKGKYSNL